MKNIKRIAEDIFKAPTKEELIRRALNSIPFVNVDELFHYDEERKISHLFPNGAYRSSDHDNTSFAIIKDFFTEKIKHWTEIRWKRIRYSLDWYKGKLNGKNVVRADMRGNVPVVYYFEKGVV